MVLDSHPEKNQKTMDSQKTREGKGREDLFSIGTSCSQPKVLIGLIPLLIAGFKRAHPPSGYGVRGYSHDLRQTPFFHLDLLQLDLIHLLLPLPQSIVEGGINQPSKYGWFIITFNYITLFCSTLLYWTLQLYHLYSHVNRRGFHFFWWRESMIVPYRLVDTLRLNVESLHRLGEWISPCLPRFSSVTCSLTFPKCTEIAQFPSLSRPFLQVCLHVFSHVSQYDSLGYSKVAMENHHWIRWFSRL